MIFNLIITLLALSLCEGKRYDGFMLLRGLPGSEEHLEFFKNVTKNYDVNVWQPPGLVNRPVDFIINPDHAEIVKSEARDKNIPLEILHSDIQSALDNQTVNTYSRRNTKSFNFNSYYRANDIVNWMMDLKTQYPHEISLFSIGKSLEGRDIMCMKIIFKGSKRRSKVVIEGGIHAREWIGTAMVTYIISELIHARNGLRDQKLKDIAYNYEWFIIPIFNIDGYEYSHTTDRMWRKNRRGGHGVDLNRNFDAAFGTVGVTLTDKESEEYCGPKAFSEPETQHIRRFMQSTSKHLPISHYISFHAYGQLFIIPYAYTKKHLENFNEMKKIGDIAAARIKKRYGTEYTVGTAFDTVGYMAAGVSACWAKKTFQIPYVNVFELRDTGKHGFALPANQIKETCLETMDGLMEVLKPRRTKLSGQDDLDQDQPNGQAMTTLNGLVFSINVFLILLFGFIFTHRPKVIIEGGSHGREWISPMVVTFMIHALVNANNTNSEELKVVAPIYDWFLVPVMNPDGYVYSQTQDRLWKKNRRGGYGVDLNRNFGISFGNLGAKKDKRDDEYCGREAFSEPESTAMATLVRDNSFRLEYYLSFHAYGQYIILPYSFSKMYEDNYNSTKKLADAMALKLLTKYQIQYKVGTNFDTQGYLASGVSADWVKNAINVPHVATIMLPDTGAFGFALPIDHILPTCQATLDGLLAFLDPPSPEDEDAKLTLNRDGRRLGEEEEEEDPLFFGDELIRDTRDMDIEFVTLIRDLQSAFNNQTIKPYIRRRMESFDWKNYYSVEDIYNWLRDLSDAHPREVRIQSIGQSIQNRHILAVKIELGASGQTNRPVVMVEGGSHAREWISPAFVTFMINTILNSKNSTNQELKQIANSYKWIFIPLLNPDGYAYSQTDVSIHLVNREDRGYVASGTSGDWVKKTKNVSYTLTIELPDQGYYGFTLPKEKILPTCEATMDALLPFLDRKNDTKLRIHLFNGANRHKNFKTVFFIAHNCIILIGLRI
ncbi:uncharacterized protein LOC134673597 [Cydia fagiglandana]|uniref:uncharacterized protein LOC134673597 n=1 Tax=Cydia fagiglandana TaxID=1458189 RepID=UPI002FEE1375